MKRFINSLVSILVLFLGIVSVSAAETGTDKDFVACFAAWDSNMNTLRTDFVQTTEYDGVLISRSNGRIYYTKNGPRLRLDSLENGKTSQSALTDKKKIFVLDEKGQKVTEVSWSDWLSGQPNQALFDFGNYASLLTRHKASVMEHQGGNVILQLTPKDKKENYILYISIGEKDCFPHYIAIQADLMKTSAELADRRLNTELNKDIFKGMDL